MRIDQHLGLYDLYSFKCSRVRLNSYQLAVSSDLLSIWSDMLSVPIDSSNHLFICQNIP